ncbi:MULTISPECIES: aldehyde dehydrogenase family protein [Ensifer]|jgi:betaine-aldehyde dehydrogenase|uniref:aldehyde dehydrogenase family protein n=1 Tax=Ensifer TaxID=106591 RepID=UPI0007254E49|nr:MULTISPECIES: aldehyde dehydrogenase family protein [Ensifer]KSV69358.1 sorbosone dehydrogenase [Sinorhizobium sp. GL2]MBD9544063.1 aldehyde dehydrogenase family protein [Ensifer sp. ENS04]OKP65624.1 sorbosone dehydrogenase [Ensifer adhaerens]QHG74262.1 aldehyde dehydrogenase family protein [Ensifer adhaerens]RAS02535.1 acyl-CoA reductase-like NAD-dependent aldehyde dehydrogenase [Ensifer adhaerens]
MDQTKTFLAPPSAARSFGFFIDGQWKEGTDHFERASPGHGTPVTRTVRCTIDDLNAAVAAARNAFEDRRWSGLSGAARASVLLRVAEILRRRRDEIAYWETLENGKPISQARGEIDHCIACFEVGAGAARLLHGDSFNSLGDDLFGMVLREPIGVIGLITPWNFPFLILCERVPFILASGCTMVVKPSEVTSVTTLLLAEVLAEAGLPAGVYNVVTGSGRSIGQALAEHPDVDMLSFTGSTAVGRSCVHAAADSNFKKLGLELGGKNPIIVFADSDLEDAADGAAFGISFNTGQCCVSSSRLIVERSVAAEFEKLLVEKMKKIRVGDPLDEGTQVGAITTEAQNATILDYIAKGKAAGAKLLTGGETIDLGHGQYIAPTLFSDVSRDMAIARDEIFGPVLCSMHFDTVEEAIQLANDTVYGLAASVWTKNIDKALTVTRKVRAGRFWVNTIMAGGPEMPLGGFKQSGWGREAGVYGVEEYTQVKSVHVEIGKRSHWIA